MNRGFAKYINRQFEKRNRRKSKKPIDIVFFEKVRLTSQVIKEALIRTITKTFPICWVGLLNDKSDECQNKHGGSVKLA